MKFTKVGSDRTIDKSDWIRGQWDDEPDKVQFQDESTAMFWIVLCLVLLLSVVASEYLTEAQRYYISLLEDREP